MSNPINPSIAQNFKAGDKLAGCYTLKEMLPSQGQCVVWLAHDEELSREIALHFIPDSVAADARAMSELKQETKRNRQLIHPRIVRVHDLIEDDKWAAISMDNVPGETLASLRDKRSGKAFNPSELAAGVSELCQTLEDAHRIELFHRDLTPENLLATGSGLMVQKFGISRVILDSLARGGAKLEGSRAVAYASPQQLDGQPASRADDIYGLGATLFDLLAGAPPFTGSDAAPAIAKTVPPLVSERRAAAGLTAEPMPRAWDETIAACLAKPPADRPKSAAEAGSRFATGKGAAPTPAAAGAAMAASAGEAGPGAKEPTPAQPADPKQAKRPWGQGPVKTPVVTEATVISKTDVPKPEAPKSDAKPAGAEKPAEPATEKKVPSGPGGPGGPTTPSGFPLRAFVEVDDDGKRPRQRSSGGLVAAVVAFVLLIIIVGYLVARNNGGNNSSPVEAASTPANDVERTASVSPPEPGAATAAGVPAAPPAEPSPSASAEAPVASAAEASATPAAAPSAEPAAMQAAPAAVAEAPAGGAGLIPGFDALSDLQVQQMLAEKSKAVDNAKAALATVDAAAKEQADAQAKATGAITDIESGARQKADAAAAAKKAADDAAARLKAQQEALARAQADADSARKTADDIEKARQEQAAALQKAQADADTAKKSAGEISKSRQAQAAALQKAQADLAQVQANIQATRQARSREKARKAAEEAARLRKQREEAASRLATQAAAAAKAAEDARKALEVAQKAADAAARAQRDAEQQAAAAATTSGSMPAEAPLPAASPAATPAAGAATTPAGLAPSISVHAPAPGQRVDQAMVNSLGMRFAPVGNTLFCIWLTRVQDFEAFASATGYKGNSWRSPGFKQTETHPVVNVSWNDANQFCLWLTQKEHHDGILAANQTYRLPSDLEWSTAVGLPSESGRTPESRDMDVPDVYPWGVQWPPPAGAGNYTGEETDSDVAIKGYNDGFAWTSPVGSFNANKYGLYDMGGNVWQWCLDWWNSEQKAKVLRGGSWYNGALKLSLLSSCRIHAPADQGTDNYGFRVVITQEQAREKSKKRHE